MIPTIAIILAAILGLAFLIALFLLPFYIRQISKGIEELEKLQQSQHRQMNTLIEIQWDIKNQSTPSN